MAAQWMLAALAGVAILFYARFLWKLCSESSSGNPRRLFVGKIIGAPRPPCLPGGPRFGELLHQPSNSGLRRTQRLDAGRSCRRVAAKRGERRRVAVHRP